MPSQPNRLKELRQERNISLNSFSKELKEKYQISLSPSQLMYYENGKRQPRNSEIWNILADFFGVPVAYLLNFIDDKEENIIDYKVEDKELIKQGRELVKMLLPNISLEQFEELYHKQSALPPITSTNSDGITKEVDTSYIVHEKLTHIYWFIGVAPKEHQEMLAKWSLLKFEEHRSIIELLDILISYKLDYSKKE